MKRGALGLGLLLGLAGACSFESARAEPGLALRFVADPAVFARSVPVQPAADKLLAPVTPAAPAKPALGDASWPVTLEEAAARRAAARSAAEGSVDAWPESEVKAARMKCRAILQKINAVAMDEPPIKQGRCGTPAPIRLISFGRKPEVIVSPPALINCDMALALHTWVTRDLQPLARRHLGAPIVKIEKMSDYSCRNAYGRAKGRLSEHGRANALDIAGFVTAKGQPTMLLADWGPTQRQIRAQIAIAKANAARMQHVTPGADPMRGTLTAERAAPPPTPQRAALSEEPENEDLGTARAGALLPLPGVTFSIGGSAGEPAPPGMIGRLGGPLPRLDRKAQTSMVTLAGARAGARAGADRPTDPSRFLREAHASACRMFGTVLGPEANNAHRNHFHIDLAPRRTGPFCQ